MLRRTFLSALAAGLVLLSGQALSVDEEPGYLFAGIDIEKVRRLQMRTPLINQGFRPVGPLNDTWFDRYESNEVFEGSSELKIGYGFVSMMFARATYTFPAINGSDQTARIVGLVRQKYGEQPLSSTGRMASGPFMATWKATADIEIRVERTWPERTTYLTVAHVANEAAMEREQERLRPTVEKLNAEAPFKLF